MNWLFILALSLSSSLDNLGVGMTYGIRKIHIGFFSNLLISAVCFVFSYSGIVFGKWISTVIPGTLPTILSVLLLFAIGLRIVWLSLPRKRAGKNGALEGRGPSSILQNSECIDFDKSNNIGYIEALVLGIVLSVNALTNGLSAGLLDYTPLTVSLAAAIGSLLTVWLGTKAGQKVADIQIGAFKLGQFGSFISGSLLILIAIKNFF